ncbi:MAG: hypothetical protein LBU11_12885, partial [Zoogloeaceae bacterium]|jgi:hypothetical protein|nr:hypothetical protein [Zoogloeaceae bacterium]
MTNYKEQKTKPQNHKSLIRKEGCAVMLESGSVFGSTRRWLVLARWRVVALAAALGWAGVCVADAEQQQTAVGAGVAGEGCSNTVPIQIMMPGYSGDKFKISVAEIPRFLPHFRAFVTTVTEHINSRLAENKLCVNGAESMESMRNATWEYRSLLQFVHWDVAMGDEYLVPAMTSIGGRALPDCRISSPWIELAVYRKPTYVTKVPQILGIVRWNKRQMLADQAALDGAKNVLPGVVMPLTVPESGSFAAHYEDAIVPRQLIDWAMRLGVEIPSVLAEKAAKPVKERNIPPDLLWFYQHHYVPGSKFRGRGTNYIAEKSAEGYTKLVLALVDRCFASDERTTLYYTSILEATDLIPLEQYKIDMSIR